MSETMTDQASETPQSTAGDQNGKAVKDRTCPFCGQTFTSSSLGRHLDLYIKAKNPKPPDGIHDMEQIRKMRGNITRRVARNSLAKKDGGKPSFEAAFEQVKPSSSEPGSPIMMDMYDGTPEDLQNKKMRVTLNQPSWVQTGVINNLPPRPSVAPPPEARRDVSRHQQQKAGFDQRQKLSEELENGRAATLALREVLNSLRDASVRSNGAGLFDFDPYTLNFPSLCLHILPAPSTLFSPTPFPTSESWSLSPPGQKQYEALSRTVKDRLLSHQRQRQQQQQYFSTSASSSVANSPLPTPPLPEIDQRRILSHLQDAWMHWKSLPDRQKQEAWQLEILRSYTRADEARKETEARLEATKRELERLSASRYINMGGAQSQHPMTPSPSTLHMPTNTTRDLSKSGFDAKSWDYDRLLDKWKNVVRESNRSSSGMSAQRSLSTPNSQAQGKAMNGISTAINAMQQALTPNGTPHPLQLSSSSKSTSPDQGDGEGDDDDEDADAEEAPEEIASRSVQPQPVQQVQQHSHTWPQQQHLQPSNQQQQQQHRHQQQQQQQQLVASNAHLRTINMNDNRRPSGQMLMSQGPLSQPNFDAKTIPSNMSAASNMMPMDGLQHSTDAYMNVFAGSA